MEKKRFELGVIHAGLAYFIWGLLPIYWKSLHGIPPGEILANRIFWSFIFMILLIIFTKKNKQFLFTLKEFKKNKLLFLSLMLASIFNSINWFIYIWAVNTNHMVETSLGYYINPLVSVLLGIIFLKEKLSGVQYVAFVLASIGVGIISFSYGRFPWIAIVLALTFGLYGLAKKLIKVDSSIGLTLETMIISPVALFYIIHLFRNGSQSFLSVSLSIDLLLIGSGVATALPLLYFTKGAQKIPLSMLGFLQYIAPTLMLILGVVFYGEEFTKFQLFSFIFIWAALIIYSLTKMNLFRGWKARENRLLTTIKNFGQGR